MVKKFLAASVIAGACLLTGCADAFLSVEDTIGFKTLNAPTGADTYIQLTGYTWVDDKPCEKIGGPWIWQLPVTAAGHTNWASVSLPDKFPLNAPPNKDLAIRFHYRTWQAVHNGAYVHSANHSEGWSQIVKPINKHASFYVSNTTGEGPFDWWLQCKVSPIEF